MGSAENTLDDYRAQIDALDDKLLDLLSERANIVHAVGELKGATKRSQESIIRPGREAEMIRRISRKFKGQFPRAGIAQLWRIIIASSINIEESSKVSTFSVRENRECYWLAREYFGAFTAMEQRPTTMDVLRDLLLRDVTVGVLPLWEANSSRPWWSHITDEKNPPFVFAKIPFIQLAPSKNVPLVSLGYVTPERTDDDKSLWVIVAEEIVEVGMIESLMNKVGLKFRILHQCRVLDNPTTRHLLIEFDGFLDKKDRTIAALQKEMNLIKQKTIPVRLHYLGAYATPIAFQETAE